MDLVSVKEQVGPRCIRFGGPMQWVASVLQKSEHTVGIFEISKQPEKPYLGFNSE